MPGSLICLMEIKGKETDSGGGDGMSPRHRSVSLIASSPIPAGALFHDSPGSFAGEMEVALSLAGELISTLPGPRYSELSLPRLLAINTRLLQSLRLLPLQPLEGCLGLSTHTFLFPRKHEAPLLRTGTLFLLPTFYWSKRVKWPSSKSTVFYQSQWGSTFCP